MQNEQLQELVRDILTGVDDMIQASETRMLERMDKQKHEILACIENGVQKDVRILAEKVTSLDDRVSHLESDMREVKEDLSVVRAAVTTHDDAIRNLKIVK